MVELFTPLVLVVDYLGTFKPLKNLTGKGKEAEKYEYLRNLESQIKWENENPHLNPALSQHQFRGKRVCNICDRPIKPGMRHLHLDAIPKTKKREGIGRR